MGFCLIPPNPALNNTKYGQVDNTLVGVLPVLCVVSNICMFCHRCAPDLNSFFKKFASPPVLVSKAVYYVSLIYERKFYVERYIATT